jgi:hypothetical protein
VVKRQLHLLEQGILPPELEKIGLQIFGTRENAIAGMKKAKQADKVGLEHIIQTYEAGEA